MKGRQFQCEDLRAAAGLAALALTVSACASSGSSSSATVANTPAAGQQQQRGRGQREHRDRENHRQPAGARRFPGHDPALVRHRHPEQVELHGPVRDLLAGGQGPAHGRLRRDRGAGVLTRSDGTKQATYLGHPLYTYVGDKSPGQATGNGKNLSGGLWYEMTVSGSTPAPNAGSTATSTSGWGGGAYGYEGKS